VQELYEIAMRRKLNTFSPTKKCDVRVEPKMWMLPTHIQISSWIFIARLKHFTGKARLKYVAETMAGCKDLKLLMCISLV
jgi:hypothetical protein